MTDDFQAIVFTGFGDEDTEGFTDRIGCQITIFRLEQAVHWHYLIEFIHVFAPHQSFDP